MIRISGVKNAFEPSSCRIRRLRGVDGAALLAVILALLPAVAVSGAAEARLKRIAVDEYRDKVHASWLGQVVGNIYGLSYEFRFIDEPGPDDFPYGYGESLERVRAVDGAFSDDDTDIEYMYLLAMERHGIEPQYAQLAEAWTHHVRDRVWVANRQALTLMRAGYGPPLTGQKALNPQWFQIDPQLVNEIWAVTAPGMIDYAVDKSDWAARITSDDFGVEPTLHYAAMYAAAFFESDVSELINIGTRALPEGSRFAGVVEHMKDLHRQYPDDWQAARRELADTYFRASADNGYLGTFDYNRHAWAPVDAILNGACGILALLYGDGDFQRTLDVASGLGFDADNQAATMSGLLAIAKGAEAIPDELLHPAGFAHWTAPFNDRYVNVSRHDLPDAAITDIAARTAELGEKIILANGGRIVRDGADSYYAIDTGARFRPPLELPAAPVLLGEEGQSIAFRFFARGGEFESRLVAGRLPPGVALVGHRFEGVPAARGMYDVEIELAHDGDVVRRNYGFRIFGENLARSAEEILVNAHESNGDISLIRDADPRGDTFYNHAAGSARALNHYGYSWVEPQRIASLVFNPGLAQEFGGWFTSLTVEYRGAHGDWLPVSGLRVEPPLDLDNSQWLKGAFIDHVLSFEPVEARAIRITGMPGGVPPDSGEDVSYYTSISELAVYGE